MDRIVIACIGKIGDMIVSNFAVRKIRSSNPTAEILLITLERNRELLRYETSFDRVRFFRSGLDVIPLIVELRRRRVDLLVDFNDNPSSTSMRLARYGGAKATAGFAFPENRRFLTIPVDPGGSDRMHSLERRRKIVEALDLVCTDDEVVPQITIGDKEKTDVWRHLSKACPAGSFLVAVNVSAGHPSRYWRIEGWMELLVNIQEAKRDLRFLFLFRPDDVQAAQNVAQALPVHSVLFPQYDTFHHFAAYIASARMLLSPDTSAIHIAAANRVPVLGLYPAVEWNYWRWRPVNTLSRTVRPQQGLVPDIGVPEVLQAFHELLEEIPEGDGPKRSKLGDPPAMTNTVGGF